VWEKKAGLPKTQGMPFHILARHFHPGQTLFSFLYGLDSKEQKYSNRFSVLIFLETVEKHLVSILLIGYFQCNIFVSLHSG
jgi:hypothetical protein